MSNTVDERIVQMKFDNSNFESNAKTSISTLEKLKEALKLDGAADSFNKIESASNTVQLKGLQTAIDTINYRFSAMGIAGATVIQNLATDVYNTVKNISSTLTNQIKTGGFNRALNIEQARFQLKGLFADAEDASEKVETIFQNASNAVDGTAYSLDAAATVASQLAASSIEGGEDMEHALKGVAGVAAMTSSTYEDIGNIFTAVAGNGRLMGDQLLQLSSRGLNAASTIAKYLGKTEAEVREMVTKGEIDFETFSNAMYEAFGEHAKEANETFSGSLSNVKAALSRIGADVATPALSELTAVFNGLRVAINNVRSALQPFIGDINEVVKVVTGKAVDLFDAFNSTFDAPEKFVTAEAWEAFAAAGGPADAFSKAIINVAREHDIAIDDMIAKEGSFVDTLKNNWLSQDILDEATEAIDSATESASASLEELNAIAKEVEKGNYGNGAARVQALTEAGYDYATVQSIVNHDLLGWEINLDNVSDAELKNLGYTDEEIAALKELGDTADEAGTPLNDLEATLESTRPTNSMDLLVESIRNIAYAAKDFGTAVKTAFDESFSFSAVEIIQNVIKRFNEFTASLRMSSETSQKVTNIFKGFFSILKVGGNAAKSMWKALSPLTSILKTLAGSAFTGLSNLGLKISENEDKVNKVTSNISKWINSRIIDVIKRVQAIIPKLSPYISNIGSTVSKALSKMTNLPEFISSITKNLKSLDFSSILQTIVNGIKDKGSSFFSGIFDSLFSGSGITQAASNLSGIFDSIQVSHGTLEATSNMASMSTNLSTVSSNVKDTVDKLESMTTKSSKFSTVISAIASKVKEFKQAWDEAKASTGTIQQITNAMQNIENSLDELFGGQLNLDHIIETFKSLFELKLLKTASTDLDKIKAVFSSVTAYFKALKKAALTDSYANAILKCAIAVAILAAALIALAQVPSDKLMVGAKALAAIAIPVAALIAALAYLNKIKASKMSAISIGEALQTFAKKISGAVKSFLRAASFVAMLVAVKLIIDIVKELAGLDGSLLDKLIANLDLIKIIIVAIVAIALLNRLAGDGGGGIGILAIVFAIKMLLSSFEGLADSSIMEKIKSLPDYLKIAGVVILAVLSIMALLKSSKGSKSKSDGLVGTLIKLVTGLVTLLKLMQWFSQNGIDMSTVAAAVIIYALMKALAKVVEAAGNLKGVKTGPILVLALALAALMAAFVYLATMKDLDLAQLIVVALGMSAIMLSLGKLFKSIGEAKVDMSGAKAAAVIIVATVGVIAAAIAGISAATSATGGDWKTIAASAAGMCAVLLTLSKTLQQIIDAAVRNDLGTAKKIATSIAAVIAPIAVAIAAISAATSLTGGDWTTIMASAVGMCLVLGTLSKTLGSITKQAVDPVKAGETALTIAAVIAPVTIALMALLSTGADWQQMIFGATSLSEVLIAVTACAKLAQGINPGACAEGAASIDAFIAMIGGLVAGLGVIDELTDGKLLEALQRGIPIGEAIGKFFGALVGGFVEETIELAAQGIKNAIDTVVEPLGDFADAIGPVADSLKQFDGESIKSLGEFLQDLYDLGGLSGGSGTFESINTMIVNIADALEDFISKLDGLDFGIIDTAVSALMNLKAMLLKLDGTSTEGAENFKQAIKTLGECAISELGTAFQDTSGIDTAVGTFMTSICTAVTSKQEQVDTAIQGLVTSINNGLSTINAGSFSIGALGIGTAIINGISQAAEQGSTAGAEIASAVCTGLTDQTALATTAGTEFTNAVITAINNLIGSFDTAGANGGLQYASGIRSKSSAALNAGRQISNAAVNGAKGGYSGFYQAGVYAASGYGAGIRSQVQNIANEAANLVRQAIAAANNTQATGSPAKEYIKVGRWGALGYAVGLAKNAKASAINAATMVRAAIQAANEAVETSAIESPTITPVVDMSAIQNGSGNYTATVQDATIQLAANVSALTDSLNEAYNSSKSYDGTNVETAVNRLGQQVAMLGDKIERMQFIFDTGVTAGELADPMNRELGARMGYVSIA